MSNIEDLAESGFRVGKLYILSDRDHSKIIPRDQISYVSASYRSNRALVGLAIIVALVAIGAILNGTREALPISVILFAISAALLVLFWLSRRIGIVIASSGGEIFIESRGSSRFALLEEIYRDLGAAAEAEPEAVT